MEWLISLLIIIFTSLVIYWAGNKFTPASSNLGDRLRLPRSVKGATFDAVSSSMPELMVALFSVIAFKKFEVGLGTIAGSALFNLLVIPALCVLFASGIFAIKKNVVYRDAVFYIVSVLVLIFLVLFFKTWGFVVAFILLLGYFIYLVRLVHDSKKYRKKIGDAFKKVEVSLSSDLAWFFGMILLIGIACYFLTEHSILFAEAVGIPPVIVGFTIIAAATSVPDTIISVLNAKKGDFDDAASNVFGSNIFDIFVGLGLPLLIASFFVVTVMDFAYIEILLFLLFSSIIATWFFFTDWVLSKREGIILFVLYVLFVVYVFLI